MYVSVCGFVSVCNFIPLNISLHLESIKFHYNIIKLTYRQNLKWRPMLDKVAGKLVTLNSASARNQWYSKDTVFWLARIFVGHRASFQEVCRYVNWINVQHALMIHMLASTYYTCIYDRSFWSTYNITDRSVSIFRLYYDVCCSNITIIMKFCCVNIHFYNRVNICHFVHMFEHL